MAECGALHHLHTLYFYIGCRLSMEEPIKIAGVEDAHVERKAKRKRLKRLCSQIRDQVK